MIFFSMRNYEGSVSDMTLISDITACLALTSYIVFTVYGINSIVKCSAK